MEPLAAFTAAASLGLAGGLAPGPLTALVITRALRYGPRAGAVVALAPVLTDGPLLIGGAALAAWLPPAAFGGIALSGAAGLVSLDGLEDGRPRSIEISDCARLADIDALARCRQLTQPTTCMHANQLSLSGLPALEDFGALGRLEAFDAADCPALASLALPPQLSADAPRVRLGPGIALGAG